MAVDLIYSADPIGEGQYHYTLVGELVRCGECKWYRYEECSLMRGLVVACDNDYCSYGERREDG